MYPTTMQPQPQVPQMPATGDGGDLSTLLQRLTPEQMRELMGLGSLGDQSSHLEQQMAQAHALRRATMAQQPHGWGAGIANGLAQVLDAVHERQLEGQQRDIFGQQTAGRSRFADLLRGGAAPAQTAVDPTQAPGSALNALTAADAARQYAMAAPRQPLQPFDPEADASEIASSRRVISPFGF